MAHSMDRDNTEVTANPAESDQMDRPGWLAAATGFNCALAVSYLACKPPQAHTLSWTARVLAPAAFILLSCLAGAAGTWIALSRERRNQFRGLVRWGARGWVFLPAMMLFLREKSPWAPILAMLAASLMAAYLNRLTGTASPFVRRAKHPQIEKDSFITQFHFEGISWISFAVSLCLYGAVLYALQGKLAFVTLFLGATVFLLASQIIAARLLIWRSEDPEQNRGTRPYSLVAVAFLCAFVAVSVSSRTAYLLWPRGLFVQPRVQAKTRPVQHLSGRHSSEGYQAIVLWPIRKKEKVISLPPLSIHPGSHGAAKPWTIPFDGPYWYFKTPGETPGPEARTVQGDSLKVNVRSTNSYPLLMEAHQKLVEPVLLTCCREIQVVFKNDVAMGATEMGLSLTDSHSVGKNTQNLGVQYVALDGTSERSGNSATVEETLTFAIPKAAKIRSFDQMTVVLFPDPFHLTSGRKVAIERFVMIPN